MRTSKTDLPTDDLRHLEEAFNRLGEHKFGSQWPSDMSERVRLGSKQSKSVADGEADILSMGRWALSALEQCVQNGWLPLLYFVGDRKVWYYTSSGEPTLLALYPKPTTEEYGQIELFKGGIHPCMVDLRDFSKILIRKFGEKSATKRGPKRGFKDLDMALDNFFAQNSPSKENHEVHLELRAQKPELHWPGKTVRNERINEAKHRAKMRFLSAD